MRVLLIHPCDFPDPRVPPPLLPPNQAPPLGLAYIASFLRRAGHDVAIHDMRHSPLDRPDFTEVVRSFDPALVGMGLYTVTVPVAEEISQLVKGISEDITVVVGGPHPAGAPEESARNPHFDLAAVGEGEQMMLDLVEALEAGTDLAAVAGLWFTRDPRDPSSELVTAPPRGWIEDLDSLPWPARDLLPPLDSYQMTMFQYAEWPATTIYTSRGCPYSCIFCERREILGNKFRVHSPGYVVDEIEHLIDHYGIREIFFYDDTFTLDKRRVKGICKELLARDITISWNISTHVNTVDRELLHLMRKAGCWQIAYGVETGDPRVMQDIMKGTDITTVRERIEWTVEAGIVAKGLFMIGHPTDSPESIDRTIEFARSLPIASANFKITTPFVGTPLRDMAADYGELAASDYRNFMGDPSTAVFVTNGLTHEYLLGVQRRAYHRFYSQPGRLLRIARSMAGRKNLSKWVEGARIMARLSRQQSFGPERSGVLPRFLEFEH
jgi:radical SAM superfamily enzyme YgiQ (UPF0313 family)